MKGIILDYSIQRNDGVITAQDGSRYKFTGADWKADSHPERGQQVDFEVCEGKAMDIYMALPDVLLPARPLETVTNSQLDVVSSVPPPLPHVEALPFTNSQPDDVPIVPAGKVPTKNKKKIIGIVFVCIVALVLIFGLIIIAFLSREIAPSTKTTMEEIYKEGGISNEEWTEITADNKITNYEAFAFLWSKRER